MLGLDLEIQRLVGVRGREMREHAAQVERAMESHLRHELEHLVVAHADAVHARIDRQMVRRAHAERVGRLGVGDRELGRVDGRRDLVREQKRRRRHGRLGEDEDRGVEHRLAQLDGLVDRGDAQPFGAGVERGARHLDRAVAVRVGLDDGHQTRARAETAAVLAHVVADGGQVDLDPRPTAIDGGDGAQLVRIEMKRARSVPLVIARILERALSSRA